MENIYIHIPFCARLCTYCTFAKTVNLSPEIHKKYINHLKKEFLTRKKDLDKGIKTIYFGGGTPSLISDALLTDLINFLHDNFDLSRLEELSLESHPASLTQSKVDTLETLGFTRLSLGIQTFNERYSNFLSRDLSSVYNALEHFLKFKGDKNVDMIFGLPGQSAADLERDLSILSKINTPQLSYYALDYKPGSIIENKQAERLNSKQVQDLYLQMTSGVEKLGYIQHEIYSFTRDNSSCLHNDYFWQGEDYYGFGASAVSLVSGVLLENASSLDDYFNAKFKVKELSSLENKILLLKRNLRFKSGLNLSQSAFSKREQDAILDIANTSSYFNLLGDTIFLSKEAFMDYDNAIAMLKDALMS